MVVVIAGLVVAGRHLNVNIRHRLIAFRNSFLKQIITWLQIVEDNGSCSAACQLFHEQTIRDTIDQGGYALVPFQVINDKQNEKHGFPRTGVQWTDLPHAHWCVIAGYATTDNSKLLAKHWGENRLFDIDELGNSNQGCYPLQQTNNITAQRASKV